MLSSIPLMCYTIAFSTMYLSMLYMSSNITIMNWNIYSLLSMSINLDIILEWSSTTYSSIIMFISGNVLNFSKLYMKNDLNNKRFTYMVICFIMSMNLLVYIPNLISLLIGWDGLGITSFLLIIYYNNSNSLSAGVLTILMNRFGDVFLLMSIITLVETSNWLPFYLFSNKTSILSWMGIFIASMTKSAQFPYSSWLPAAMAAPTPVSALVHSSTLVTGGIFILHRFKMLILSSQLMQYSLLITGIITMITASISASMENDMKKIIALSTLSQLGLMTMCLGMTMFNLAFFHMMCHAIFKALLFITAGLFILSENHNQDLRMYNQLSASSPMISSVMFISSMTMIGMPYMTGYYSKHSMMSWFPFMTMNTMFFLMFIISIFFTALYSSRLMIFSMITLTISNPMNLISSSKYSSKSMFFMSITSIMCASMLQWMITITPFYTPSMDNTQHLLMNFMISSAMLFSLFLHLFMKRYNKMSHLLTMFFSALGFLSLIFSLWTPTMYLKLALKLYKDLEQSWLEKIISLGPSNLILNSSKMINKFTYSPLQLEMMNSLISLLLIFALHSIINFS